MCSKDPSLEKSASVSKKLVVEQLLRLGLASRMHPEEHRILFDPEGRYPGDGPRIVEAHALRIIEMLPGAKVERTRDVIQIDESAEQGIVVVVTAEAVEVRIPTIEWTQGTHGPAASSRLWKRVTWEEIEAAEEQGSGSPLYILIRDAQIARMAEFRECRYCGQRVPSERRVQDDVCRPCAEKHLGLVF